MTEERHRCRRCREKIAPVSNVLEAFCTKGCFRIYYTGRCIICDGSKSGRGVACTRPACRMKLAQRRRYSTLGRFVGRDSGRAKLRSAALIKIGVSERHEPIIGPLDYPVNLIGGYRFAGAPNLPPDERAEILRYR